MIFFSIGLLVLIGLCFFYRLETSAPGLSGYYWYIHKSPLNYPLLYANKPYIERHGMGLLAARSLRYDGIVIVALEKFKVFFWVLLSTIT